MFQSSNRTGGMLHSCWMIATVDRWFLGGFWNSVDETTLGTWGALLGFLGHQWDEACSKRDESCNCSNVAELKEAWLWTVSRVFSHFYPLDCLHCCIDDICSWTFLTSCRCASMVSRPLVAVGDTFPLTGTSKKPQLWQGDSFQTTFQKSSNRKNGPLETWKWRLFSCGKIWNHHFYSFFRFQPVLELWGWKFYESLIQRPLSHPGSLQPWRWVGHGLAAFSCYPGTL